MCNSRVGWVSDVYNIILKDMGDRSERVRPRPQELLLSENTPGYARMSLGVIGEIRGSGTCRSQKGTLQFSEHTTRLVILSVNDARFWSEVTRTDVYVSFYATSWFLIQADIKQWHCLIAVCGGERDMQIVARWYMDEIALVDSHVCWEWEDRGAMFFISVPG